MNKLNEMISSFPEAAKEYIKGKKLDEVECVIADLPGIARGKAVPATKFSRQNSFHLPDSIFFQTITGGWGEAAGEEGFVERDMILKLISQPPRQHHGRVIGLYKLFMTHLIVKMNPYRLPPEMF